MQQRGWIVGGLITTREARVSVWAGELLLCNNNKSRGKYK